MLPNLAARHLADRSRGLLGWALGLACYTALIVSIFPTIRDSPSFAAALDDYPEELQELFGGAVEFDLTSGPSFIGAELYYLILPLLLATVAIGFGAAFGADQESGLMDLLLSYPISRTRLVLERALAMTVAVALLAFVVAVVVSIAGAIVDLGLGVQGLAAGSVAVVLLVLLHGFIALGAAAGTGRRSAAIGIATAAFGAGYLLNVAAGFVDAIEQARVISPYHHAFGSSPVANGWEPGNLAVLALAALAALSVAVLLFNRRDLG